jgi:1,4-dihydroxy-2-naphthoate octaprenyltransferase
MSRLLLWIKALRAPFFIGPIMSAFIASALAFNEGHFSWVYLVFSIVIIIGINAGINLTNDYFDHINRSDEVNRYPNIFSGGSRVIQEKLIPSRLILLGGIISFLIVTGIGLYLVFTVNFNLIWFGLAGIVFGYFYTASPFKIVYRGWGEFFVFLLAGPIAVVGSYFLITGDITLKSILISLPQGFLIMLILFINEFPDYEADKEVNKKHLVVRLGRKKSSYLYVLFIAATYLAVLIPVAFRIFPLFLLIILINLPLAVKAILVVLKKYDSEKEIFPAQANAILFAVTGGILLSLGYIFDKIFT